MRGKEVREREECWFVWTYRLMEGYTAGQIMIRCVNRGTKITET